jgi:hypothetical protein
MGQYSGTYYNTTFLADYDTLTFTDTLSVREQSGTSIQAAQINGGAIFNDGGTLTAGSGPSNASGAAYAGGVGVGIFQGGSLNNAGRIAGGYGGYGKTYGGSGGAGVEVYAPAIPSQAITASITNTGIIRGGEDGYGKYSGVSNGIAHSHGGAGVLFDVSATLLNDAGGIINGGEGGHGNGGAGVELDRGGSVVDAGYIHGGNVYNSNTVGGIGLDLSNGGSVSVTSTGEIKGGNGVSYGANGGAGVFLNGGTLTTAGIISGGDPGLSGAQGDSVDFGPTSAKMIVSQYASFIGDIGGFHHGDTIDLTKVAPSYIQSNFNPATDTVYASIDGTLTFAGDPTLTFTGDGAGGTLVRVACFRRGTLIATERGERPVETLAIGDRIATRSGLKTLRWIGKRHYSGHALFDRNDIMPVLIRAGALGEQLPRRDLWVSPEHALYFNGALVPASLLTNGVSIFTDTSVRSVSYFHLEFDSHEVVFAEGVTAESFVDDRSRAMFDNAAEYALLYPDAHATEVCFCAPRVEDGEALETVRLQLAEIAGVASRGLHDVVPARAHL